MVDNIVVVFAIASFIANFNLSITLSGLGISDIDDCSSCPLVFGKFCFPSKSTLGRLFVIIAQSAWWQAVSLLPGELGVMGRLSVKCGDPAQLGNGVNKSLFIANLRD